MQEPISPSGEQVELSVGDQRVVVVGFGGGLRRYSIGDEAVLDGYSVVTMCGSGRGQLLAPWPNRIQDGSYEFGGESYQLALDEPERRNAIHGLVRWSKLVGRRAGGGPRSARAQAAPDSGLPVHARPPGRVHAGRGRPYRAR